MNKYYLKSITLVAFIMLNILPGCKTTPIVKFTLTVNLGTGASGTPASGTYQKDENSVVSYSYTLDAGYQNLVVTLDGIAVAANGTITVTGNHTLQVTADEIFDIRGDWTLTLNWDGGFPPDIWDLTFTGGLSSGTFMDEYAHTGTYTVDGSSVVINYPAYSMKLVGTFSSQTAMSGDITDAVGTGTWSAAKK